MNVMDVCVAVVVVDADSELLSEVGEVDEGAVLDWPTLRTEER